MKMTNCNYRVIYPNLKKDRDNNTWDEKHLKWRAIIPFTPIEYKALVAEYSS